VVFVFLQGWRRPLFLSWRVPVSLVGPLRFFPSLAFRSHALPLRPYPRHRPVVDDAIVVVEAVEHHIEKGLSPKEASFKAMEEVSGPVMAIAIILAAVSSPRPSSQG